MDTQEGKNKNIPHIQSCFVAWYINKYVDWDEDLNAYVSKSVKRDRQEKTQEIQLLYTTDSLTIPSIDELEFLYCVEQDKNIKTKLAQLIAFWTQQQCQG